jgi:DNA primase catalytic subunit
VSVVQDSKLPRDDEERRLIADYEACNREQLAAADQLSNPRHSMLYPAYKRLVDTLTAIRLKCNEKWFAVRAYRKKMRDEGK